MAAEVPNVHPNAKEFRVDYRDPTSDGPSYANTYHDTEAEARMTAEAFILGGSPDTHREAYVSRQIALYYMRHSVSSIAYLAPALPNPPPYPQSASATLTTDPNATMRN